MRKNLIIIGANLHDAMRVRDAIKEEGTYPEHEKYMVTPRSANRLRGLPVHDYVVTELALEADHPDLHKIVKTVEFCQRKTLAGARA